jgi:hypothetical protein
MDDVRWFAPNPYTALVAHQLEKNGLAVALKGDAVGALTIPAAAERFSAGLRPLLH